MFGIGTSELIVVAVLALMLFSPRELPKILRSVAQFWGSLRRTADEFRDAIMQEEAMQDLKDAVDGTKAQLRDAESAARRELMKARMEARRAEGKLVKVSRERERQEREAAAKELGNDGSGDAAGALPDASQGPAPQGTVAAEPATAPAVPATAPGVPATAPAVPKPPSVGPKPPSVAPKSIDPRHVVAAAPASAGDGSSDDASQGAA